MKKVFKQSYSDFRISSRKLREAISKRDELGMKYWYRRYNEATDKLLAMGFTF